MTGRDIFEKISYSKVFLQDMLDFAKEGNIDFAKKGKIEIKSPDYSALEFLTLYCVLLSSSESSEYDPNKLLKDYKFIKSRLKENGQIDSNEFLSHPLENMIFILQNNICTMQK